MKILRVICCLMIVGVVSSCLSTSKLLKDDSNIGNDLYMIEGVYSNTSAIHLNSKDEQSLYILLFKNFSNLNPRYNEDGDYSGVISIKVLSDSKIKVDYLRGGQLIKTKNLKGSLQNGFFVVRRKWLLLGIPMLLGGYEESKIAIGLDSNNRLFVKKGFYNIGGIVGFANYNETYHGYLYEKIDGDDFTE